MTMIIIIVFMVIITNFKHVKSYKFWIFHLDITRKNSLYWILNFEIHLDAMDIEIPLKKEIKHLSN